MATMPRAAKPSAAVAHAWRGGGEGSTNHFNLNQLSLIQPGLPKPDLTILKVIYMHWTCVVL